MKRLIILLFIDLLSFKVGAQNLNHEILSSSGETFKGTFIQIDWTLGELATSTIQSNLQITQGFHQPHYLITNVSDIPDYIGNITVYPNPSSHLIYIKQNFKKNIFIKVLLTDLTGNVIWSKDNSGSEIIQIENISFLTSGTYYLHFLFNENKNSQTFKIIKTN